ncbi:LacI family DNA-binding transcriptional regulator [Tetragenococcus koreensis]|uniref:Ribose operon repressor n=1 Tax=Tetragenococcus koreensis TaxID=290335 RepID=A0AAN4RIT1_9ENTE|nr:LacI family DNA-binding transcriptional regulator [Tetragenococcus koreensis]AYW45912.1 LacI family transcriptional regulator [Tetragenococcus koreensis]MCF1622204.1 LacI family transcriptional regulator [Tetragenococcus koreensis]MCF1626354.1 LacI family transcriptional regulator [Tetragenococcus koreensis]MCF1631034.1 LacI family transcriptional regulator [Tetragenococcus koreensis]MCF1678326.1 LacI family transcriptional regulator [Tetragenococcus koreensis]
MKLTIRQIAEIAGVSVTTVSQILNHKGGRFSTETRQRVHDVVEKYQYKPDFFASNLVTRHSKTIGMIVPDVTDSFFSKIVEGAERYTNPLGYMLVLCNSHHKVEKEIQLLQQLADRSVEGVLLATPNVLPKEYGIDSEFSKTMPLGLIDRGINQRDRGRLVIKEYEGAYQAVSYLLKKGHRNIGLIKEDTSYYQLEERYNGYYHALKDAGVLFKHENVATADLTVEGGYQAAQQLLKRKNLTAIFCSNDAMAMGCYRAIYERKMKIPDDISVIGFDGLSFSKFMNPPLTTIEQPVFDIGFTAAKFIVDAIEFPERRIPNKIFETKLIFRESVKDLTRQ